MKVAQILLGLCALFASMATAAHKAPPLKPNLLLITVDTLRPDALGWIAAKNSTPYIDALAREGVRFPAAVSPAPITLPAHISLMTGQIPRRHGVRDNGQILGGTPTTLAEILSRQGYRTAAVVSGYPLAASFGLDRGFDHYDDALINDGSAALERTAAETTRTALRWIATAPEPWALWVHYYDPHDPYEPPAAFLAKKGDNLHAGYYGEVSFVDDAVGRLHRTIQNRTQASLLTVLTADHGESLGEHGENTHGFFVYDSTVVVPLIFHNTVHRKEPPSESSLGHRWVLRQSDAAVRLVDVAPTILDLLDMPALADIDGVSLRSLLDGRQQDIPPAYVESQRPWLSYGWAVLRGIRHEGWKLIVAPEAELYHLSQDPLETVNLLNEDRRQARSLQALLRQVEAVPASPSQAAGGGETLSRLRALGYVGAGRSVVSEPPPTAIDPKRRIDLWNTLGAAETLLARRRFAAAAEHFETVLEKDPLNPFALARSAAALLPMGKTDIALQRLRKAVDLRPQHVEIRQDLARSLSEAKRFEEASQQWMELTRLQPRSAAGWMGLGNALGLQGDVSGAVTALQYAVEAEPRNHQARVRLAFAQNAAGNISAAVDHLLSAAHRMAEEAATEAPPLRFPYAAALGILLLRSERFAEARTWLSRSHPQEADFIEGRLEWARFELRQGNVETARKVLQEALQAVPSLRDRLLRDPILGQLF